MAEDWKTWSKYVLKSIEDIEICLKELKQTISDLNNDIIILKEKQITINEIKKRIGKIEDKITDIIKDFNKVDTKIEVNKIKLAIIVGLILLTGSSLASFLFNYVLKLIAS